MAVEPDEKVAARPRDARVQTLRDPSPWIRNDREVDASPTRGHLQPRHGAVRRAPVGDEHLDRPPEVLCGDVRDEALDMVGFIEHRRDDRDATDPLTASGFFRDPFRRRRRHAPHRRFQDGKES
jgi:hypothetical protein